MAVVAVQQRGRLQQPSGASTCSNSLSGVDACRRSAPCTSPTHDSTLACLPTCSSVSHASLQPCTRITSRPTPPTTHTTTTTVNTPHPGSLAGRLLQAASRPDVALLMGFRSVPDAEMVVMAGASELSLAGRLVDCRQVLQSAAWVLRAAMSVLAAARAACSVAG